MCCQQFEQFLISYLDNLIEFIRPTSYYIKIVKSNPFFHYVLHKIWLLGDEVWSFSISK